ERVVLDLGHRAHGMALAALVALVEQVLVRAVRPPRPEPGGPDREDRHQDQGAHVRPQDRQDPADGGRPTQPRDRAVHAHAGAQARRRRARYDVKPTRTGGITKNHFIVPSGISAVPFGAVHRCATTSRIEYREDVKIQAIRKAIPKADRNGAFAGRLSRPRSMKGRTRRKITGMPLSRSPQNAALNSVFSGVPASDLP